MKEAMKTCDAFIEIKIQVRRLRRLENFFVKLFAFVELNYYSITECTGTPVSITYQSPIKASHERALPPESRSNPT
eukprot:2259620-Amphidinium_carterae.2